MGILTLFTTVRAYFYIQDNEKVYMNIVEEKLDDGVTSSK